MADLRAIIERSQSSDRRSGSIAMYIDKIWIIVFRTSCIPVIMEAVSGITIVQVSLSLSHSLQK